MLNPWWCCRRDLILIWSFRERLEGVGGVVAHRSQLKYADVHRVVPSPEL